MKKLMMVLIVVLFVGCSSMGNHRYGYVIHKDGDRHDFKDALIYMYEHDLFIVSDHVIYSTKASRIKEINFKYREKND
jgi:hypothetical protein